MDRQTQHSLILNYLKTYGSITTYEGFEKLFITKTNSRAGELIKMGYPITKQPEKNNGKKYMRYFWQEKPRQLSFFEANRNGNK